MEFVKQTLFPGKWFAQINVTPCFNTGLQTVHLYNDGTIKWVGNELEISAKLIA